MRLPCLAAIATGLLLSPLTQADILGFSWDNDLFVGQDKNYTNGVRLSWVDEGHSDCESADGLTCGTVRLLDPLPGISAADEQHAFTVSLEQIMITPSDIKRETPDYSDIPYVGYADLELGLFSWNADSLYGYGLRIGVVGPDSGAEESQKIVHRISGSNEPEGWDNQLGPDIIGGAYFINAHRLIRHTSDHGYQTELGTAWGIDANNFNGNAQAGGFIRFGRNLPGNFIPDYAGIGSAGSLVGLFDNPGFGWEVFFGLAGQYVGYSYIEEKGGDYDVEARDWVGTAVAGLGLRTNGFSFTMTVQNSTSPIRDSDPLSFGNMSFMWAL